MADTPRSDIAPHPVLAIAFDRDDEGIEVAVVEGIDVYPEGCEDARDAAVRTVADMVDAVGGRDENGHSYDALLASVVGDPSRRCVVIYRDGRMYAPTSDPSLLRLIQGPDPRRASVPGPMPEFIVAPAHMPTARSEADPPPGDSDRGAPDPVPDDEPDDELEARLFEELEATLMRGAAPARPPALSGEQPPPSPASVPSVDEEASARADDWNARLSGAADRLASPGGSTAHVSETEVTAPRRGRPSASARPRVLRLRNLALSRGGRGRLGKAAGVLTLVLLGGATWQALVPHMDAEPGITGRVPTIAAPPGFAAAGSWSTGPLDPEAGPTVALGDALGYVTADGVLTVADAATGGVRWRQEVGTDVQGHLAPTRLVGTDSLAIHANGRLRAWNAADGSAVAALDLPANAEVTYLGESPLVGVGPATVAVVNHDGLANVAVPPGAHPLAAFDDRTVTAAGPDGWWHLRPEVPPGAATPWETPNPDALPADARPHVLGYIAGSIVLRYPAFLDRRPEVVVHTDSGKAVRVAFRGLSIPLGEDDSLDAAPASSWGIHGRTLIDTRAGAVSDLGNWSTTSVTPGRGYGTVDGAPATVTPGSRPVRAPEGTDSPEAAGTAGAVVRAIGPATDPTGTEVLAQGQEAAVLVPPAS